MPTYQYACTECGEQLEAVQSFSDAALTECPACGGKLRKVFSSVGVVFKGSGFYRNDSRPGDTNGDKSNAEKNGDKSNAGSGTEGAKSDKPATTSSDSSSSTSSSPTGGSTSSSTSGSSTKAAAATS